MIYPENVLPQISSSKEKQQFASWPMGMVGEACLPSNAYYLRTPDYTIYSGVHGCWSEHSDSSFVYGFMRLDYGFDIMTTGTSFCLR